MTAKASSARDPLAIPALVASMALPGLGHAILGRGFRGAVWCGAIVFVWALCSALAVVWLGALGVGLALTAVWVLLCAVDAFRQAREPHRVAPWVVYGVVCVVTWLIAPVACSIVIRATAVEAFKIPSGGMCPTLQVGDHIFADKTAYRGAEPQRGDIVVHEGVGSSRNHDFVRRIVAVGGDEIAVVNNQLTVNGDKIPLQATTERGCNGLPLFREEMGAGHLVAIDSSIPAEDARALVPRDQVYVVGDNRCNSYDSRSTGSVPISAIKGKVWRIWMRAGRPSWQPVP